MIGKHRILRQKISSTIKNLKKSLTPTNRNIKSNEIDSLIVLIGSILRTDKNIKENEFRTTAIAIKKEIPTKNKDLILKLLTQEFNLAKITKTASNLSHLNLAVKESLLQSLIEIACTNERYTKREQEIVDIIRIEFSISESHAYELWKNVDKKTQRNNNIIASSTALGIVLVIIIIFILAAAFLLSIIFGLILAYFFLPIQYWFKNTVIPSKLAVSISRIISITLLPISYPFKKISFLLPKTKKLDDEPIINEEDQKELNQIKRSCRYTVLLVMAVLLVFLAAATLFSTTYFAYATKSITNWAKQASKNIEKQVQKKISAKNQSDNNSDTVSTPNNTSLTTGKTSTASTDLAVKDNKTKSEHRGFFHAILFKLESITPMLDKNPIFKAVKTNVAKYLKDPENIKKLLFTIASKAGGLFSYTAGIIGMLFMLLMNIVLTFFFFAFFLGHMAQFNNTMDEKATPGEHIVNGILNSGWLPDTTRETRMGTIVILNNIFARLRSWIRGYLTIIIIETVFYVTTFLLVGVPYGILLGLLAGLTILLPYIGTIVSVILTVTICLTLGTGGMVQVVIVLLLYTIMGGIIEQLFIYPAVVGRSLGLNEFETIVLVLLGGILFGIPGMIFAVPVASVLKYLIPQVYKIVQVKKSKNNYTHPELE